VSAESEDCRRAESQLQPYLDRVLTAEEVVHVEEHLRECGYCSARFVFERRFRDTVRHCCEGDPVPVDLVERLRLRLRDHA